MAKCHVVEYFLEMEDQYFEMLDNLKELKDLLAEKKISEDEYISVASEVELLKINYERLAYVMFLLNQPNRKSKKLPEKSLSWYKALKYSSKEAIINENNDCLSHIKNLIDKGKLTNEV